MFGMEKSGSFTRCLSDEKVCCGSTEIRIGPATNIHQPQRPVYFLTLLELRNYAIEIVGYSI